MSRKLIVILIKEYRMNEIQVLSRLEGKVAVVTGGGSGIGQAATEAMVKEGGRVLIVGRRKEPLKLLVEQYPERVRYLQVDISSSGASSMIVDTALESFGRLDVLVNNAGVAVLKPLALITDEEIDQMLSVNIKGMLALSREAMPALEQSNGSIINISSVAGQTAVPGFTVYASTKSAIDRISKILAAEVGPMGIRVNVVAPGLTQTDMLSEMPQEAIDEMVQGATALRRIGTPEDVAQSITWLASDESNWVTGQIIQASGGLLLS